VFLSALSLSGQTTLPGILGGFLVGGAAGSVIGALIYYGVLRAGIKSVFQLAAVLLALLGAGLAAQAAGFLVSAGWLPPLIDPIWDSSPLLPDDSVVGQLAHALFGYISQPSAVQVAIYAVVLAAICWLGFRAPAARTRKQRQPAE
jgi:high-affinity iron transporter